MFRLSLISSISYYYFTLKYVMQNIWGAPYTEEMMIRFNNTKNGNFTQIMTDDCTPTAR